MLEMQPPYSYSHIWHCWWFQHNRRPDDSGQKYISEFNFDGSLLLLLSFLLPPGHVGHSFTALLLLNIFSLLLDVINDQSIDSTKQSAGFFSMRTEPRGILISDVKPISCFKNYDNKNLKSWRQFPNEILIQSTSHRLLPVDASFRR